MGTMLVCKGKSFSLDAYSQVEVIQSYDIEDKRFHLKMDFQKGNETGQIEVELDKTLLGWIVKEAKEGKILIRQIQHKTE